MSVFFSFWGIWRCVCVYYRLFYVYLVSVGRIRYVKLLGAPRRRRSSRRDPRLLRGRRGRARSVGALFAPTGSAGGTQETRVRGALGGAGFVRPSASPLRLWVAPVGAVRGSSGNWRRRTFGSAPGCVPRARRIRGATPESRRSERGGSRRDPQERRRQAARAAPLASRRGVCGSRTDP